MALAECQRLTLLRKGNREVKISVNDRLLEWFCTGETGVSSEAIARTTAGFKNDGKYVSAPADAWDFRRCVLLLRLVPEAYERGVLVLGCKRRDWKALAGNWPLIERTLVSEIGTDLAGKNDTPRTYKLMKDILERVRDGQA